MEAATTLMAASPASFLKAARSWITKDCRRRQVDHSFRFDFVSWVFPPNVGGLCCFYVVGNGYWDGNWCCKPARVSRASKSHALFLPFSSLWERTEQAAMGRWWDSLKRRMGGRLITRGRSRQPLFWTPSTALFTWRISPRGLFAFLLKWVKQIATFVTNLS